MYPPPSHRPTNPVPGYHSVTAYKIPMDQADAIVKTCSYHMNDFDRAVIWFPSGTHSGAAPVPLVSRECLSPLGDLDKLPLELIQCICLQLDMLSLFHLRQTSSRARQVINALHEYKVTATHALDAFCALLWTRSASRVTVSEFYKLLCTANCSICRGQYGNLVFLPTWIRCCSRCLWYNAPQLRVASVTYVKRTLELSKKSLANLPTVTLLPLPAIYPMEKRPSATIVSTYSAALEYVAKNSGSTSIEEALDKLFDSSHIRYMACCALPTYDPQSLQVEYGVSCAGCQLALECDIITGELGADVRDMVYSREGFLKHFIWCEKAQLLWTESVNGAVEPKSMPAVCKEGSHLLWRGKRRG
ncbi:uncharacterized protein EI97DRAFT_95024 [Westerdykella ornata]|uniref:F-box domain-containing protein n=1 Tax=Westerdykella ornata TaxID=318751 RepID=A0A6A6JEB4_WESOR|nr:uncharacterized protein EI97DRAFT_95024 [Westerdykella ornata]KAF2274627.1 hypothetical protein EI97DRAFT_95024 [Westerdykella ornata]